MQGKLTESVLEISLVGQRSEAAFVHFMHSFALLIFDSRKYICKLLQLKL